MPTAHLTIATLTKENIAGDVLIGCQLAKVGVIARFADLEGKTQEIEITATLVGQLAQLAEGKSIPAHWSHDYLQSDKDSLHARVGAWKNVRVNEGGDLVGDLHLMPSQYKEAILWLAENTPDGAGMSAVFDYNDLGNRKAYPLNFDAADVVSRGAATTAMFSKVTKQTAKMAITIDDLKQLLADPEAKALIQGSIDGHTDYTDEAAAMEADAGVTDADKKDDDAKQPALMAAMRRVQRATLRKAYDIVSSAASTAAKFAEAAVVTKLGSVKFAKQEDNTQGDTYTAKLAEYRKTAPNDVVAGARLLKDHPELMGEHEKATRARCARMVKSVS